jgi:two-component system, chemotaxis family, CheB/CheR fusion protein
MSRRSDWRGSSPESERGYQIAKIIRDVCVFARHNLAQDPPFSKLDLISCCNVLIYLGDVLQRKVCRSCSTPSSQRASWCSVHRKASARFPSRFIKWTRPQDLLPAAGAVRRRCPERRPPKRRPGGSPGENRRGPNRAGRAERSRPVGAGRTRPPGAVIDDHMNIVQVRGRTAPYLELSPGEPTQNLLKLAREGLIAGLGKAIRTARKPTPQPEKTASGSKTAAS